MPSRLVSCFPKGEIRIARSGQGERRRRTSFSESMDLQLERCFRIMRRLATSDNMGRVVRGATIVRTLVHVSFGGSKSMCWGLQPSSVGRSSSSSIVSHCQARPPTLFGCRWRATTLERRRRASRAPRRNAVRRCGLCVACVSALASSICRGLGKWAG